MSHGVGQKRKKNKKKKCIHTHTHTHTGTLLSHNKEWNNAICSITDEPRDHHAKWSKSDKESQISYDITYTRNLKNDINEIIYKMEIDSKT